MEIIGITGTKGFVGKNLIKKLKKTNKKYVCFKGNLLNKKSLENFFKRNNPTTIIHLAGTFNPPFKDQINGNLLTTWNILEIGLNHKLKKIIYASSYAVYGEAKKPFIEKDKLNPTTSYALSKVFAEDCINFYTNKKKINSIILRFSNIYGKNNNKGVIHDFIKKIKINKKIIINGNGNQSRNFIHVNDACTAIIKSIDYKNSAIFNIGSTKEINLNQLANELKKKYIFEINYINPKNKQESYLINSNKAKKLLKFTPKFENIQEY